ncbi:MAG: hypothetical protein P4N59_11865 [Negativicutes bacterium]|nr:hypothetical protein [Negativicutes bacterium]
MAVYAIEKTRTLLVAANKESWVCETPEIRKVIGSYIEEVVDQDHCEVVFFFWAGMEKVESLCIIASASRRQVVRRQVA